MKSRHRAREVAFQVLYRFDLELHSMRTPPPEGEELIAELVQHFEHFKVPDELREFAYSLVVGTLKTLPQLDESLEKHSTQWKVLRMTPVDRTILRMALYEMGHFPEVPTAVTLDEAIELAKQFGSDDSPAFVNGILDAVVKSLANPAESARS